MQGSSCLKNKTRRCRLNRTSEISRYGSGRVTRPLLHSLILPYTFGSRDSECWYNGWMNKKSIAAGPLLLFLLSLPSLFLSLARSSPLSRAIVSGKKAPVPVHWTRQEFRHTFARPFQYLTVPRHRATAAAAVVLLLSSAFSVRLPSRRQNAISNQFKCKLKTTMAYKLFDSPSKNTASKDQTEDKTRGREGGVYGADGRDRTRKGAPEKGISNGKVPTFFTEHRDLTGCCYPLFSLLRQKSWPIAVCSTLRNGSRLPMLDCPLNICLSLVPTKVGLP